MDDEPALLEVGKIFLEQSGGIEVTTAGSAAEALELLAAGGYDAIVSDYQMPEMDGIRFLQIVRQRYPEMPFIIFTGKGREEVVIEALNNGVDFYLQKGGDPKAQFAELRHNIDLAVERRRLGELYRTIFDATGTAMIMVDDDTTILLANRGVEQLTGFSRSEIEGKKSWTEFVADDDLERMVRFHRDRRTMSGSAPENYEFGFIDRDGKARTGLLNLSMIPGTRKAIISVLDITERKQAEYNAFVEHDLAMTLARASSLKEALPPCVHAAISISGMDSGGIYLIDEESGDLVLNYATGLSKVFLEYSERFTPDSVMARRIMAGEVIENGYGDFEENYLSARQREGMKAGIDVPICHNNRIIGCYNLASRTKEMLEPSHRKALEAIAAQVGSAIARIKAEEAHKKSEAQFRDLASLLPLTVFETDLDGRITYANRSAFRTYGYSWEDFEKGVNITETVIPGELDRVLGTIHGGFTTIHPDGYEYTAVRKDGSTFRVIIYAAPILQEERPIGIRGVVVDIDERKAMEDALKESEERLNMAIDGAGLGVWDYHVGTKKAIYNRQWAEMLGYSREEIEGDDGIWERLVHPEDLPGAKKDLQAHYDGGTPYYESYYRMRAKDGRWKWIHATGKVAQRDEVGRPVRITGIHQDITETIRYREALRETNKKLNLLSSITRHDILNQITGILGYVGLLGEMAGPDPGVQRYIDRIGQLTRKIEDHVVFTQHYQDLGVQAPCWQPVEEVVNKAVDIAQTGEIDITVETGSLEIFADPLLLRVFLNLIENAARHGKGVTAIRFSCEVGNGQGAIFVKDNGCGIPVADKERVFQRGIGKNTGLGLFLTREILGITGISIQEVGLEGEGAIFRIDLPPTSYRVK